MTKYPPTSMFIHYARDYRGDRRLRHVSKNLNVSLRFLKKHESEIKPILEFVKDIDNKYHNLLEDTENADIMPFLDTTLHNHISSDVRSCIILGISNQNYQINMILRHLIECVIITVWADFMCCFKGTFSYLLEDTREWNKPYKDTQKIVWSSDVENKNRSVQDRLEHLRLKNFPELNFNDFVEKYFDDAKGHDFSLLFSLPICDKCMHKRKDINFIKFNRNPRLTEDGREDFQAVFKSDFGTTCAFCNKTADTKGYAMGIPNIKEMKNMLIGLFYNNAIAKSLIPLIEIYDYLSQDFVHFSATRHPDENPPLCEIKSLQIKKKIWGLKGVLFCKNLIQILFDYYFSEFEKECKRNNFPFSQR